MSGGSWKGVTWEKGWIMVRVIWFTSAAPEDPAGRRFYRKEPDSKKNPGSNITAVSANSASAKAQKFISAKDAMTWDKSKRHWVMKYDTHRDITKFGQLLG